MRHDGRAAASPTAGQKLEGIAGTPSSTIFRPFTILLNASLAPLGVRRVSKLVRTGFLDGQILYRVIPGFLVQFGVAADPTVHARWQRGEKRRLKDEPNRMPFRHGTPSAAGATACARPRILGE